MLASKLLNSSSSCNLNKPMRKLCLSQYLAHEWLLDCVMYRMITPKRSLMVYKMITSKRGLMGFLYVIHLAQLSIPYCRLKINKDPINPAPRTSYARYDVSTQVMYEGPKIVEIEIGLLRIDK